MLAIDERRQVRLVGHVEEDGQHAGQQSRRRTAARCAGRRGRPRAESSPAAARGPCRRRSGSADAAADRPRRPANRLSSRNGANSNAPEQTHLQRARRCSTSAAVSGIASWLISLPKREIVCAGPQFDELGVSPQPGQTDAEHASRSVEHCHTWKAQVRCVVIPGLNGHPGCSCRRRRTLFPPIGRPYAVQPPRSTSPWTASTGWPSGLLEGIDEAALLAVRRVVRRNGCADAGPPRARASPRTDPAVDLRLAPVHPRPTRAGRPGVVELPRRSRSASRIYQAARLASVTSQLGMSFQPSSSRSYLSRPRANVSAYRRKAELSLTFDARPWLGSIACPAFVLTGSWDPVVPPRPAASWHDLLPQAQLCIAAGRPPGPPGAGRARAGPAGDLAPLDDLETCKDRRNWRISCVWPEPCTCTSRAGCFGQRCWRPPPTSSPQPQQLGRDRRCSGLRRLAHPRAHRSAEQEARAAPAGSGVHRGHRAAIHLRVDQALRALHVLGQDRPPERGGAHALVAPGCCSGSADAFGKRVPIHLGAALGLLLGMTVGAVGSSSSSGPTGSGAPTCRSRTPTR